MKQELGKKIYTRAFVSLPKILVSPMDILSKKRKKKENAGIQCLLNEKAISFPYVVSNGRLKMGVH